MGFDSKEGTVLNTYGDVISEYTDLFQRNVVIEEDLLGKDVMKSELASLVAYMDWIRVLLSWLRDYRVVAAVCQEGQWSFRISGLFVLDMTLLVGGRGSYCSESILTRFTYLGRNKRRRDRLVGCMRGLTMYYLAVNPIPIIRSIDEPIDMDQEESHLLYERYLSGESVHDTGSIW